MQLKEVKSILIKHKKALLGLGVRALALFGSVVRNQRSPKSDVDILVELDSKRGLFEFMDIKSYLEDLLNCRVDLVTKSALHPALKTRILKEAKYVF